MEEQKRTDGLQETSMKGRLGPEASQNPDQRGACADSADRQAVSQNACADSADQQAAPTNEHKEMAKRSAQTMKRLYQPIKGRVRVAQLLTLFSSVIAVAPYIALVRVGNILIEAARLGVKPDKVTLMDNIYLLVAAFTVSLLLHFLALTITHFADLKLRDILRRSILKQIARVPLAWFTQNNSGALRKAVQDDTATVHTVIAHAPVDKLRAIVSPLALLAYVVYIDWRLALLAIATLPIYFLVYSLSMRGMAEKTAELDTKLAKISSTMVEFVAGISVVKAFGRIGKAHGNYIKAADECSSFYMGWCMPLVNTTCFSYFWISVPILLLVNLGGGSLLLRQGAVTLPELLASTLIALVVPLTIYAVSVIAWSYQLAGASALRLVKIIDTPVLPQAAIGQTPQDANICIENVSFSYGETEALKAVSLNLQQGTVTSLLGPSGSGKSTLAKLIARFADPDSGSVKLGGVDLRDIEEAEHYKHVSFVLQDAQLLQTSIRNNIALAKPTASLEEIRKAAKMAQIDDFIMSLPKQYDTILAKEMALSGGQEQRIAIARAVLIDAPVMILDEATAFADPESEAEIQQALSRLVKGRTVLAIAHRPASIIGADQIVVMDEGRIVACGKHEELLEEPHYKKLLQQSVHALNEVEA